MLWHRRVVTLAAAILSAAGSGVNAAPAVCAQFEGAIVIADGEYIGKIANKYASDSIFNKYGTFGSKYASKSIWNKYGTYGSAYSTHSPFNKFTSSPPMIIVDRELVGYLSTNESLRGAINPLILGITCYDFEPD